MTWLLSAIFSHLLILSSGSTFEDTQFLMEYLESNNTKNIRPRINQSIPLDVYVQTRLYSIVDFDVSKGRLTLALSFFFTWQDELKSWDPTDYGGIRSVRVPASFVFIPDLNLYISLAESNALIGNDVTKERIEINSSGQVYVVVNGVYDVLCEPGIEKFPFDQHTCPLEIPASRPNSEIQLTANKAILNDVLQKNSRWKFENSTYEIRKTIGFYDMLHYDITFRRYPLFLALNLVVPVYILTIVNPLVFLLPVDSGERVSFSITLLLSFVVFVSAVSDKLPEVSEPVCMFNTFIIAQLVYSSLITFTVISLSKSVGTDSLSCLSCRLCDNKNEVDSMRVENEMYEKREMTSTNNNTRNKCRLKSCNIACFTGFMLFAIIEMIVSFFVMS